MTADLLSMPLELSSFRMRTAGASRKLVPPPPPTQAVCKADVLSAKAARRIATIEAKFGPEEDESQHCPEGQVMTKHGRHKSHAVIRLPNGFASRRRHGEALFGRACCITAAAPPWQLAYQCSPADLLKEGPGQCDVNSRRLGERDAPVCWFVCVQTYMLSALCRWVGGGSGGGGLGSSAR